MTNRLMDWKTFWGALSLLIFVSVPLMVFPKQGKKLVLAANDVVTQNLGFLFLTVGLLMLMFLLFVGVSRYGDIKLGDVDTKPEFRTSSWAAMLFTSGIGTGILYWGVIEWAYYYQGPPFGLEPGSKEAIQWASTYGFFHWGPIAWAMFAIPALPIGYMFFVRKTNVFKISEACRPALGKHTDGFLGRLVDILFMFGLLGGGGTGLALSAPIISEGLNHLAGLPNNIMTKSIILFGCTLIFGLSAYSGLQKGIRVLSDINLWLAFALLIFIFSVGPTTFMTETTVTSLGRMMDNFFSMSTWAEPFNDLGLFERSGFPEGWTVFYWAWWIVYAPFVGLFIARISKGRTIRQVVFGTVLFGSLGTVLFFGILGNYSMYLELSGQYPVIETLNNQGAPAAIIGTLTQLPLSTFAIIVFVVLAIIFLSTTYDSGSYVIASVVQKHVEDEPLRWNRLFWALALSVLPMIFMYLGGLKTLQTISIIGGFPLLVILPILGWSFIKMANEDKEKRLKKKQDEAA
ncbi:BCCT family transporter [Pontibacillus sp. ALD_SL1]|uniref:BCCT family transporter n=1 Tax=Pontibacillus sp. ALD_SL1 TaxID=2777185 RepID=UPI001A96BF87|nr:BCCT family transporter [Pontibacillus sp. ALD_SL1]QST01157.1 BCCT family transporter [Pontibacillus sp. ALD_SL1]